MFLQFQEVSPYYPSSFRSVSELLTCFQLCLRFGSGQNVYMGNLSAGLVQGLVLTTKWPARAGVACK